MFDEDQKLSVDENSAIANAGIPDDDAKTSDIDYENDADYSLNNLSANRPYSAYIKDAERYLKLNATQGRYLAASELSEIVDCYLALTKRITKLFETLPGWIGLDTKDGVILLPNSKAWLVASGRENSCALDFRRFVESWYYSNKNHPRLEEDAIQVDSATSWDPPEKKWPDHFDCHPRAALENDLERLEKRIDLSRMKTRYLYSDPREFVYELMFCNDDDIEQKERADMVDYAILLANKTLKSSHFAEPKTQCLKEIVDMYTNGNIKSEDLLRSLTKCVEDSAWVADERDDSDFPFKITNITSAGSYEVSNNSKRKLFKQSLLRCATAHVFLAMDEDMAKEIETECRSTAQRHESFDSKRSRVIKHKSR